jgi:hypothetical protein
MSTFVASIVTWRERQDQPRIEQRHADVKCRRARPCRAVPVSNVNEQQAHEHEARDEQHEPRHETEEPPPHLGPSNDQCRDWSQEGHDQAGRQRLCCSVEFPPQRSALGRQIRPSPRAQHEVAASPQARRRALIERSLGINATILPPDPLRRRQDAS